MYSQSNIGLSIKTGARNLVHSSILTVFRFAMFNPEKGMKFHASPQVFPRALLLSISLTKSLTTLFPGRGKFSVSEALAYAAMNDLSKMLTHCLLINNEPASRAPNDISSIRLHRILVQNTPSLELEQEILLYYLPGILHETQPQGELYSFKRGAYASSNESRLASFCSNGERVNILLQQLTTNSIPCIPTLPSAYDIEPLPNPISFPNHEEQRNFPGTSSSQRKPPGRNSRSAVENQRIPFFPS
ncbi:hypothetical protein VNO77_22742 [Canavalia gladiata]|uniref:Uncharacterized protein n=1 Tax=Canavalia gladiata TaxID=3824 RepID=A0AAN9L8E5_CANGL